MDACQGNYDLGSSPRVSEPASLSYISRKHGEQLRPLASKLRHPSADPEQPPRQRRTQRFNPVHRRREGLSYHFRVIGGGFAIPVIFEGSSRFRVDQLETRDDTVRSNCRPLGSGPGKGGSEHRRCFTSKLGVIISAVIELDRTAGVGHKPPRRLSGTFLPTLLVTKSGSAQRGRRIRAVWR